MDEGAFFRDAEFACGVGGERGGAVGHAEGVEALCDLGAVHLGCEVKRGIRKVE